MELTALLAVIMGGLVAAPHMAAALSQTDGTAMFAAFNKAYLYQSGSTAYYKRNLTDPHEDGSWTLSQDIFVAQDVYELTGESDKLSLMSNLLYTWLKYNPPPWDGDGWNDDVGWYTLALMRGYQFTGDSTFYKNAKTGYDMAFKRGWDTKHNGGGIWELQPEDNKDKATKCVLSNFSLGRVACMIYQSTHDQKYLNQCIQIYDWVWKTLFRPSTGQVIGCIVEDGTLQYGDNAYQQGLLADTANMLWLITNDKKYLNDAKMALSYAFNKVTTNGIFTSWNPKGTGYVDDLSRGAYRTIQNNRLWNTFHTPMVNNANSILKNRRSDYGITWNAWDKPTPKNINLWPTQVAPAVSWVLFTPVSPPSFVAGIHTITNVKTGLAIDSAGTFGNGHKVVQWGVTGSQNQRWLFTQNSDKSWNIVNLATWQALESPRGDKTNGLTMTQSLPNRANNQRWWVDLQPNGAYKIWNQANSKALDGAYATNNGAGLTQWDWVNQSQQQWNLH